MTRRIGPAPLWERLAPERRALAWTAGGTILLTPLSIWKAHGWLADVSLRMWVLQAAISFAILAGLVSAYAGEDRSLRLFLVMSVVVALVALITLILVWPVRFQWWLPPVLLMPKP